MFPVTRRDLAPQSHEHSQPKHNRQIWPKVHQPILLLAVELNFEKRLVLLLELRESYSRSSFVML